MTDIHERLLHILSDHPDGLTSDELIDYLRSRGEDIKSTGRFTGPLSILHDERKVFHVRGVTRNGKNVYFHSNFLSSYKSIDVIYKRKKVDDRKRCLDYYHDYVTTGNVHSLELAERLYKGFK